MKKLGTFFDRIFKSKRGKSMKARPSSSDRVLKCAGSLEEGPYPVDEMSDEARDGRAKHSVAARYVAGALGVSDIQKYADYYDVKAEDLEEAALYVKSVWEELKEHFPDALIETRGEGEVCVGTADIKSIAGGAELDWKFGWSHEEHPNQLLGYADILLKEMGNKMPECGYIKAFEVFVRFREYRAYKFTREQIEGYRARMREQIANKGKQYNAGAHCKFCPRINSCGARLDYMHTVSNELAPMGESPTYKPEDLGRIYDRVQMLKKAIKRYDDYLSEALTEGSVGLGDGRLVELQEQRTTAISVNKETWNLLTRQYKFDMNDMSKCLKITKTTMEKILAEKAGKGKGMAAKREALKNLKKLGSLKEGIKYAKKVRVAS